jgi:hypothetical protein
MAKKKKRQSQQSEQAKQANQTANMNPTSTGAMTPQEAGKLGGKARSSGSKKQK